MGSSPTHSVSVAGIVVDNASRVLVIQRRDNGHLEPPGGILELDETPQQGLEREIQEETGLEVEVERLTGVYKNMSRGVIALVFRCRPTLGSVIATNTREATLVTWMNRDDAVRDMTPAFGTRIEDAFSDSVQIRVHDGTNLM